MTEKILIGQIMLAIIPVGRTRKTQLFR